MSDGSSSIRRRRMQRKIAEKSKARNERQRANEALVDPKIRALDMIIHDLKLVDIKATTLAKKRQFPYVYLVLLFPIGSIYFLGAFGVLLTLAVGSLLPSLFETKEHHELLRNDLKDIKSRLINTVQILDKEKTLYVMGISQIEAAGVVLSSTLQQLDVDMIQALSENGRFPLGEYKHLLVALSDASDDNAIISLTHSKLLEFPWRIKAKQHAIKDEDIETLLNQSRQTTLVW